MNEHPAVYTADALSVTVALASLLQWLPPAAALLTVLWTAIRIYETDTVQAVLGKVCTACTLARKENKDG